MSTWMILRVPIWQPYYSGSQNAVNVTVVSGRPQTAGAVNSRNACGFEFLFGTRDFRPPPACAVHFVGSLRCFADALAPDSPLAAHRFSCLGNSYGIASLAVSF